MCLTSRSLVSTLVPLLLSRIVYFSMLIQDVFLYSFMASVSNWSWKWTILIQKNGTNLETQLLEVRHMSRPKFFHLRAGLHYDGEVHRSWKKGRFSIVIGRKCNSWPVGYYVITLGRLRGGTFWSWASPEEEFLVRPLEAGEAQLNKKYFIAFNYSMTHSPFASYNHVLAKHYGPTGGLLHRCVNRPLAYQPLFWN